MKKPSCFPPKMPLRTLLDEHYITRNLYRCKGQPIGSQRLRELRRFGTLLAEFLKRPPIVKDLTPDVMTPFVDWCKENFGEHHTTFKQLEIGFSLCRFVGSAPTTISRRGRKTRPLSDAPGTLWGLCLNRYFKVNIDIRNERTRDHYRGAIYDLKEAIGHDPEPADLTDENIAKMMIMLGDRGLTPSSVNDRRKRLRALWEWAARKRIVDEFPTIRKVKEPRRIPKAWTLEQLSRLFAACKAQPGFIVPGIAAADFWPALHLLLWDSSERLGAVLELRWEWLNPDGVLEVPYHVRKGQGEDAVYVLRPQTMAALARLKPAGHDLIFVWPNSRGTIYSHYNRILKRAGLPTDRKSKLHRMRRSVASHLQARGYDACAALGHSSPKVTKDSYLDPMIVGSVRPSEVLPSIGDTNEPRLGYAKVDGGGE